MDVGVAAGHRAASGRQPGVRSPTAISTSRSADRAGSRRRSRSSRSSARRHARAVRHRPAEPDVARLRPRRAGCTCRAGSTAASTASTRDGRVADARDATSASRAASRSAPTATCSSAIDPARSCASSRRQRAGSSRALPAERRRVPPGVRPRRLSLRRRRRRLVAHDALYRISPDGRCRALRRRLRPPAGPRVRRRRPSLRRRRAGGRSGLYRLDLTRPTSPNSCSPGGSLIGLAFDPHGGLVVASTETVYRFDVPLRGLLPAWTLLDSRRRARIR